MRTMLARFTMLAAMVAAVLIPAGSVSAPAAQASDPQPYGAGASNGPPTGWTMANIDIENGGWTTAIQKGIIHTSSTGQGCSKIPPGKASQDAAGNLNLYIIPTKNVPTQCAQVTTGDAIHPTVKTINGIPVPIPVYIEWKASVPLYSWAALWMTGGPPQPNNGEIDTMEVLAGGEQCQTFHYLGQGNPQQHCATSVFGDNTWHYYGVYWSNDTLKFYYDGIWQFTYGPSKNVTTVAEQVLMDVKDAGWASNETHQANLYINYVRTWNKS
jgi:hypothetical protein